MPPPNQQIFTDAEIEKMRLYVLQHDKQASVNVFDLNNPPKQPYVHQPWPKLLYRLHPEGHQIHKIVQDAEEHAAALDAGWSNEPVGAPQPADMALDPADAAEAARIDEQLAARRRQRR